MCMQKNMQVPHINKGISCQEKGDKNCSFWAGWLKGWQRPPLATPWLRHCYQATSTKPLLKQKHHQKHLTWAKEKKNWTVAQWSKVLFSDKSTFCISFGNQGPRVWRKSGEAQNQSCLKSSLKFPQSVMIWGAMTFSGVGPLCFIKSKVNAAIYQEILEHFYVSICWQALWICWFNNPAVHGTCPHCQMYQKLVQWPWCYCAWLP